MSVLSKTNGETIHGAAGELIDTEWIVHCTKATEAEISLKYLATADPKGWKSR